MNLFKKAIDSTHITTDYITTLCGIRADTKNYAINKTKPTCPICIERQLELEEQFKLLEKLNFNENDF